MYTEGSLYLLDEELRHCFVRKLPQRDGESSHGSFRARACSLLKSPHMLKMPAGVPEILEPAGLVFAAILDFSQFRSELLPVQVWAGKVGMCGHPTPSAG